MYLIPFVLKSITKADWMISAISIHQYALFSMNQITFMVILEFRHSKINSKLVRNNAMNNSERIANFGLIWYNEQGPRWLDKFADMGE